MNELHNEVEYENIPVQEAPVAEQAAPMQEEVPVQTAAPVHQQPVTAAPAKKKRSGAGKWIALALCCSILGGILGAGGMYLVSRHSGGKGGHSVIYQGQRENTVLDVALIDTDKAMTPAEVYAANVNSTVGISASLEEDLWGYTSTTPSSGSGFILSEDGYVLTNHHVVEGASVIKVTTYDGTVYDATPVGYDKSNDIAVLKVEAEGLDAVVLGDSDRLQIGDSVMAIGNPLGELSFSLTYGLVSGLNREVTLSSGITMDLIQTDCAINSGNSGGPLFNQYGEVVGITNAKYSSSVFSGTSIDNIGFAIPMNDVISIVESIVEKGYVAKPYLGVTVTDVSEEALRYGLPEGASIQSVVEGSSAEAGGLQVNDIVTKFNDTEIRNKTDLVDAIQSMQVGDTAVMKVYRKGETVEVTVEIGERIQTGLEEQTQPQTQQEIPQETQPETWEEIFQIPGFSWG